MINDKDWETLNAIQRHVELDGKTMLEIGCGDGRVTAMLAEKVSRLTAMDPDNSCIEGASCGIAGVDFQVGQGEALPFQDASFDLVLFTLSLHHHQDMALALDEAHRVLRSGGRALVIEPLAHGEICKICYMFDDETPELNQAQALVDSGPFTEVGRETFTAIWVLDDFEELINHLNGYCGRALTDEEMDDVREMLGDRAGLNPFEVADDLVLISLVK